MSNAFQSIIGFSKIVGIFILTTLLASFVYELLSKILVPDAKAIAALVIFLVLIIGCIKPRSTGLLSYRTFYIGLIVCLPILLIEKPNTAGDEQKPGNTSAHKEHEVAVPTTPKERPRKTPQPKTSISMNVEQKADSIRYKDFYLPTEYMKYMPLLKSGAPKVMAASQCDIIDYADVSTQKGTKANPVFYYTCVKDGLPTNIFVSKSDLEKEAVVVAKPIYEGLAKERCEEFAKGKLNHPGTFESSIFDWNTQTWPNGRRRITMNFTAKNSFGLELPASVNCLFIPDGKGGYTWEANVTQRR